MPQTVAEPRPQDTALSASFEGQLIGRWLPQKPANQSAFVEFGADGTYFASDGCNTASGGWQLEDDGNFLASRGGGTEIGCNNVSIPEAVAEATTISFDGKNTLELSDAAGSIMRLSRAESEPMTIVASWIGPESENVTSRIDFETDGTWIGYVGCHGYSGEWIIRIANEDRIQPAEVGSDGLDTWLWSRGTPILSIGPQPTEEPSGCFVPGPSVLPVFPLRYHTDYILSMASGHFWPIPVDSVESEQQPIKFVKESDALPKPQ